MKNVAWLFLCLNGWLTALPSARATDPSYNLKITGTIVAVTCNVDTTSANQTVTIGQFSAADFPSTGATSSAKSFDIKLTECPQNINGGKVLFSGTSDNDDPTLLALSDTGMGTAGQLATGVGVQILDSNLTPIKINNTESALYPLMPGDNTLTFNLRYKSTKNPVTAGNATAVMYFDLQYQ